MVQYWCLNPVYTRRLHQKQLFAHDAHDLRSPQVLCTVQDIEHDVTVISDNILRPWIICHRNVSTGFISA